MTFGPLRDMFGDPWWKTILIARGHPHSTSKTGDFGVLLAALPLRLGAPGSKWKSPKFHFPLSWNAAFLAVPVAAVGTGDTLQKVSGCE